MPATVVFIQEPGYDFNLLLSACHDGLGYSPAAKIDQSRIKHSDVERFLNCLASIRDADAPAGVTPNLLHFASYTALLAAEERDLTDILEASSGMSFVTADTKHRGICLGIVHGSLAQWRDAVVSGCSASAMPNVREHYGKVMALFHARNLGWVWKDYTAKQMPDKTFLLEDKRRS